jgi:hypothetical protein
MIFFAKSVPNFADHVLVGRDPTDPRSSRRSWRFALVNGSLGQPPRNTRPFVFQRVPTHEQSEMATRGNRRFDIARPHARERRRRQDLSRRRDRVSIASEERQRAAQLTQIDEAAERMEPACGDAVLTKEPVEDFQKIGPRKIERPPLPAQEGLDRSAIFFVCGWAWELKRVDDEGGFIVLPRPEIEQSPAENQSISGSDHVVDHPSGVIFASAEGRDGSAIKSIGAPASTRRRTFPAKRAA